MNERYLQQALSAISVRRNNAQTIQQQHLAEIAQTVPEIMEINQQLFHTSQDLIQIIRSGENVAERTQRLAQQNQQGQAMIRKLLVQHGYPQNYLDIVYQCPDCNDTGYANGTFCHCLLKLAGKLATKELNKSAQVQLCRFDTFSLDYYRGKTTEHGSDCYTAMQKILAYCQNYAQYFHKSSPSILMFGKTGLGKTHLSLSIASVALERGYSVLYDSVINFLRKIEREHFGKEHPETDTMELLLTCDLLILDEPTAGLDPRERVRLRTLLADMAQDRIILVATHVVSDVESVATKVILLRAGKIVDAAPVPDLIAAHAPGGRLEDVYLNVFGEGDGK